MTTRAQSVQEKRLPFLVAEVAKQIAGYAYTNLIVQGRVIASPWKIQFILILNSANRALGYNSYRSYRAVWSTGLSGDDRSDQRLGQPCLNSFARAGWLR
jgi:hypothetical protein